MTKKASVLQMQLSLLFLLLLISGIGAAQNYYLLIGCYTNTGGKGIYVYNFDVKTGAATPVSNVENVTNPSFLALSNDAKKVYAVNETGGSNPGKVSAFSFDKKNGTLQFINSTDAGGDGPCHLAVSPDGKWLAVANYSGGTASVFPINKDGSLQEYAQVIHDSIYKTSTEKARPHVHEAVFSPDGRFLYTPDLGLDKVMIYQFTTASKKPLSLSSPSFAASEKGSGPRHFTFHPNKKFAYLMHEMGGTVTAYQYQNGQLLKIQELNTFPDGFVGKKDGAEVVVSPDGKFLYVSNRGDLNSITILSINPSTGKLTQVGDQSTFGKAPRNFTIDPTGNYLLVANQDTNNIVIFKRDKKTGLLTKTNNQIELQRPVCLVMTSKE